jgi:hypothetical protein
MAKRRKRPTWVTTVQQVVGLAVEVADLIELLRKLL